MATITHDELATSLADLLAEVIDGGPGGWAYFSDGPASGGARGALARIAPEHAFLPTGAENIAGGRAPAELVAHLIYSADLFARALRGDHSGYADADWPGSWTPHADTTRLAASDPVRAWADLCKQLLTAIADARAALAGCVEWNVQVTRTGAVGNVCHFVYHLAQLRAMANR